MTYALFMLAVIIVEYICGFAHLDDQTLLIIAILTVGEANLWVRRK